jgi:hypothetical protein
MFWKKDTSRQKTQLELEQLFEKAMTDLINTINRTYISQVKVENTVTEKLNEHSNSVSEIMQSFQEQLEKMEEQFELFFHRENRQSRSLQKDINHISSRIELLSSTIENIKKTNKDIMKEISDLKPIPIDPFYFSGNDAISESRLNKLPNQSVSEGVSKINPLNPSKFYKKKGRLSYKEIKIIEDINCYLTILGDDAPIIDVTTNIVELGNLKRDLKRYINQQK